MSAHPFEPSPPPGRRALDRHPLAIDVWSATLDPPATWLAAYTATLTADERARADRFHFDLHRRRFRAGRGFLRTLLASYLEREPADLRFTYGEKGKPQLAQAPGEPVLHFNLSHSEDLALCAVTRGREVGADVEHIRPLSDLEQIAQRFFSRRESTVLLALPEADRPQGFFNCWTRKEAYVKAIGDGLSVPLDRFDVSLLPGEPARLLLLDGTAERAAGWTMVDLPPGPGFAGALAVEGHGWDLSCRRWITE